MIDFKCSCGYELSVPQELSGSSLQCPACHLLVDVPLLSDLDRLNPDGTVKVVPLEVKPELERIRELHRIYRPGRRDAEGNEIDLRATFDEIQNAGVEEIPIGSRDGLIPAPPKYDPETGELIVPLDIKRDRTGPPAAIPVATPVLNYAREVAVPLPGFLPVIGAFMSAGSLAVILSVVMVHLLAIAAWIPVGSGLVFVGGFQIVFYGLIFAHYAIVVEDAGPGERDELPVPLRGLSFSEDIWHPSVNFHGAMILSYGPMLLTLPSKNLPLIATLAGLGTVVFPVVFLICCTSGMLSDLRPDRLFGTLACCGWRYGMAVVLWAVSAATYGWGLVRTARMGLAQGFLGAKLVGPYSALIDLTALCIGILLMHVFALFLGHLYRRFHADFPWSIRHIHLPAQRSQSRRRRYGQLLRGKVQPAPRQEAQPRGSSVAGAAPK